MIKLHYQLILMLDQDRVAIRRKKKCRCHFDFDCQGVNHISQVYWTASLK